jgi:hypothetical protein
MPRKLIYLASPYSDPSADCRRRRFEAACQASARLIRGGDMVFSPIAHTHPIAEAAELPLGWEFWAEYDRRMLAACDELVILQLPGWAESRGVRAEWAIARELGKPVRFMLSDER